MNALEELLSDLKEVCAGLEDKRVGPGYRYTMADIGLAAFSVFFMQSPSFLGHQRTLAEGHGRSNCQTLFGMAAIPSDNHIRQMLDGTSPAAFDGLFLKGLETTAAADGLAPFQRLGCWSRSTAPSISARASSAARSARRAGALTAAR